MSRQKQPLRRLRALASLTCVIGMSSIVLSPWGSVSAATSVATTTATTATGLAKLAALPPVMDCAAVTQLDLSGVTDGKVTLTSATVVTSGAAPYCEVRGTIAPANTIVMRLPTQGWTQRYLQTGCGGLCGTANISYTEASTCVPVTDGTIASATTDMGHQTSGGAWAANNPQAQIDFAYRGVHVTSQVAKAVITRFYGKKPAYAYFNGCSDGGREALMAAQRYPDDFDGIAAGAPANNMAVQNTYHHGWNVMANKDSSGNAILLAGKLPMLHAAVLKACDGLDGVSDGLIDDPRRCRFEPATLTCKAGQDPATCLSAAEVAVVRRLHDGATDAQGRHLELKIAHEWGSELSWTLFVPTTATGSTASQNIMQDYYRYLAFFNEPDANRVVSDLVFDVPTFWRTVQTSVYQAALDPDLSAFARHGGKLLLWHGWNDQHISPQGTLAYHDAMRKAMGSKAVEQMARLYLFPGVTHCGGGEGPDTFDILTPVMAWVESHTEPGKVIASKVTDGVVTRTRPVFPYPKVARYSGTGSVDDAANFVAVTPASEPGSHADYEWVGKGLFAHGYQAWCQADGTQIDCHPSALMLRGLDR